MAILQASGIQFGDSSVLNSFYGIVPQGKQMVFYQAAAPTGWTKVTSKVVLGSPVDLGGSAIQVVSGTGGNFVNSGAPNLETVFTTTAIPVSPDGPFTAAGVIENTTISISQMAGHSHGAGGSTNVESGPPVPTFYQTPATRFYNERISNNVQTSYQQPRQTREPSLYQQPSAYQQPVNRRNTVNVQNPLTERVTINRRILVDRQNPRTTQEAIQELVNRRSVNRRQDRRQPNTTRVQRNARVQRSQPTPVNRRSTANRRNQENRRQPNPVNRRNPSGGTRRQRNPVNRRSRRGGRRRRRNPNSTRNRSPRSFNRQNPRTTQGGQSPRSTGQNPRSFQQPSSTQVTTRVQGPQDRREPVNRQANRQHVAQFPQTTRVERRATRNRRRPTTTQQPNPVQQPANRRRPTTTQQPRTTRVVANKRVQAVTQVVANRRTTARSPSTNQNPIINSSAYRQPLLVPGGEAREVGTDAPNTSLVGSVGGGTHNHPFNGDEYDLTFPSGFVLRLQYIDVIVCSID